MKEKSWDAELQMQPKDKQNLWVSLTVDPVRDGGGQVVQIHAMAIDISERKTMQNRLRQSQKMEALGTLAGGIAHDFNNILSVIIGNAELLNNSIDKASPLYEGFDDIVKAGRQGASLTRQILSFSRKQIMEPQVFDLNQMLKDSEKMLKRLIREDIEIETVLTREIAIVEADPSQLEQVVMNVVINARDAMPDGGKLLIETAVTELEASHVARKPDVVPGRYAMLAVSDTGMGMEAETLEKMFEPFFTTKEKTKGTGLGLATVYGIVKQHDGHIEAFSELGRGTTLKIYLPDASQKTVREKKSTESADTPSGSATVLVVEDEAAVRKLACNILKRNGYSVIEADTPDIAVAQAKTHTAEIHLLLADVIMPGMKGPEVFQRISEIHPETKVLYMSGYAPTSISRLGVPLEGLKLIQKPLTVQALLNKVAETLSA